MTQQAHSPSAARPEREAARQRLIAIIEALLAELYPGAGRPPASLDADLGTDLGLDSLGRVELLSRIEEGFRIALPESLVGSARTAGDLLSAILGSHPQSAPSTAMQPSAGPILRRTPGEPDAADTLTAVVDWWADADPERAHILIHEASGEEQVITIGALREEASTLAAGLRERGLRPGETVALMLPTGRDYFVSFLGALLAGGIAVPLYPPAGYARIEDHLRRQAGILRNAAAPILITVPAARSVAHLLQAQAEDLRHVVTPADLSRPAAARWRCTARATDTALLQYTSGSTGEPKGVVLSHAMLLANIRAMGRAVQAGPADVFVSWLPLYHDMGLIGAWLGTLYYGARLVVMSPLTFATRPGRWLWAIHRHRATLSAGPNFGYELCLRKVKDHELEGLDLSSWRLAFNGAEPISPDTLQRFAARFAPYGLRREALTPVYGMAEACLGITFPPRGRDVRIDTVRRLPLMQAQRAVPAAPGDRDTLSYVGCGQPLPGYRVRVVDDRGQELAEREVGQLEFMGPSATSGYFRNPAATRRLFDGLWLNTGDFGYLHEGEVFITGRAKEIIIRAGRNVYPYALEEAVGNLPGVRRGRVAVFGVPDKAAGTERLVLLAETRETDPDRLAALRRRINEVAVEVLDTPPEDVVLAPAGALLKTSSGKIRRATLRELYERGTLGKGRRPLWAQMARLAWASLGPQARRARRLAAAGLFGAYAWLLFVLLAPPVWLATLVTPGLGRRRRLVRHAARAFLTLAQARLTVTGTEHLTKLERCVIVANHASYLDGLVLMAALPPRLTFVAKVELARQWIAGSFLRRIGTRFVERFEPTRGARDTDVLGRTLKDGESLLFFPEGTFYRASGVQPFRMGAFVIAGRNATPVVPVALQGTRAALSSESWFPRHSRISVTIGAPLWAAGAGWHEALHLRDAARAAIVEDSGEPDLHPARAPSTPRSPASSA